MSMKLNKIVNFLQGYRELKVMAIVGKYAIVANLKGQFVGIVEKDALPDSETFSGRVTDAMKKVAVVVPASYKHEKTVRPITVYDIGRLWWGLDKEKDELVIIRDLLASQNTFAPQNSFVAANVKEYIYLPFVEPL